MIPSSDSKSGDVATCSQFKRWPRENVKSSYFAALLLSIFAITDPSMAQIVVQTDGDYDMVFSPPLAVGNGSENLRSTILSVRYAGPGGSEFWPIGFAGQIGANGNLHHEQIHTCGAPFICNPLTTPTLASIFGLNPSLDSHFLLNARVTVTAPMEPVAPGASSSEPGNFDVTGFGGPLTADVRYFDATNPPQSPLVNLAQLVFRHNAPVDFDFQVATGIDGLSAGFQGVFQIPEPATLSLIGLAMIGIAGVRRRRS